MGPLTLEPRTRLQLIAHANRHCNEVVTRESLRVQFHYETGKDPEPQDLDYVLNRVLFDGLELKPLNYLYEKRTRSSDKS
jgi:hypothetical protein